MDNNFLFLLAVLMSSLGATGLFVSFLIVSDIVDNEDASYIEIYRRMWKKVKFATFYLTLSVLFLLCEGIIAYLCSRSGNWTIAPFLICGGISSVLSIIGFILLWKKKVDIQTERLKRYL